MYEIYPLFRINCFLVSKGVEKQLAYQFKTRKKEKNKSDNTAFKEFYDNKSEQISKNLEMLYDDESRNIYKRIIEYRVLRNPLEPYVYSLNNQYFVEGIVELADEEVFVDCGAFVGDTIQHLFDYAKKTNKTVGRVIAFEPEHKNYEILRKYYAGDKKIECIESGVANKNENLFISGSSTYAKISDVKTDESTGINVLRIDDVEACHDASFIKMDIEGYETEALKGAEATIKRNKPKLAICIYHGMEDIISIIPYVHSLNPSYKLYVRHHSRDTNETVLYAIP